MTPARGRRLLYVQVGLGSSVNAYAVNGNGSVTLIQDSRSARWQRAGRPGLLFAHSEGSSLAAYGHLQSSLEDPEAPCDVGERAWRCHHGGQARAP
jgi:hypothetical protein